MGDVPLFGSKTSPKSWVYGFSALSKGAEPARRVCDVVFLFASGELPVTARQRLGADSYALLNVNEVKSEGEGGGEGRGKAFGEISTDTGVIKTDDGSAGLMKMPEGFGHKLVLTFIDWKHNWKTSCRCVESGHLSANGGLGFG